MSDLLVTLRLSGNADGAVTAVRLVKRETDGLGDSTERAARRGVNAFDGMTGSLKGFAKQAAASALAAVGIGSVGVLVGAAVGQARDFGQAMAEVSTVAADTSKMAGMTQAVRDLAKEYGQAPTAQAKALYEIISAGISDTARATETLEAANRLALGGITEVETAADGLTTVLNSYGAAAGSAADVSDRLFVAALAGKTTIGELSASIGNAAPIAAQTGVSIDELLSSVAALTLGGVKTTTAVDGIRATIAAIIKPSQEATEMAAGLGLQFDATALKSQGLAGFLKNVEAATGGSADKLAVLFGGVEALAPVMSLTGNQADAFAATLDSMANSAGVTDEAVAKMADTAQFQFARLKAEVADSLLSIGESMLTVLAPAAQAVADNWEAIASGIVVATQVTAVWLGVFVAVPALWTAATAAVSAYATARAAAAVADEMGIAKAVASVTAVQAAGGILVGAIAGWKIGTWLRENFVEAELAGIAFVEGTLVAYERLKQGVLIVWEGIKAAGVGAMNAVREAIATMFANLASAADVEVFGEKLLGSTAEGLRELEAAIRPAKSSAESLADAVGKINSQADDQVEKIRALTGDMAAYATEQSNAAETAGTLAKAAGEVATTAAGATEAIKANEAATKDAAKADKERTESLRRLIEQQQRAADDEYSGALINSEDAAIAAGRMIDALRDETAQVGLTRIELEAMAKARQFDALMRDAQLARSPEQLAAMRAEFNQAQETRNATVAAGIAAQDAAQNGQRAWTDFSGDLIDAMGHGMRGVKDLFANMLKDLARQLLQSTVLRLMSSVFGGSMPGLAMAAGAGGQQSMLGAMLGGGQGGGGLLSALFGGGSGATGLMNLFRGGTTSSLLGINQVNAINGTVGASGGAGSIFGGGMMANGMSMGGMLGAGGGIMMGLQGIRSGNALQGAAGGAMAGMSIAGPWGALVGAIVGGLGALIRGKKEPDFRLGGSDASIRNREGGFSTVFGDVQAGSRQLSWESLVGPMQQFDSAIADLVNTMGGGQPQIAEITDALATWEVDLRGSAATAENVLGSRFNAILATFSDDIEAFVGTAGTVQERVGRLTDALAIDKIVDAGELGDTFAEVSALLTDYRVGTEAIADTYSRVLGSVTLLDEALALSGTTLDLTRDEMIRFAADITEAAGGLDRAQALWASYFQSFYTEAERADFNRTRAQANAASQAGDVGLNLGDFTGAGGMAAARELFNSQLPTLSAEATVQWLEFLDALATFVGLSSEATEVVASVSTSLTDLMASVTDQLEQYAPPQTFAQRLQAINVETDTMIAQARALGATEEQLGQIRALSAARLGEVLDEQAAAMQNYQSVVQGINDELADARGLSEFQREMREINRWFADTTASLNEAARAAGLQGAAEQDLAAVHELAAIRAAQAIARLEESGRGLVEQLYGTPLERLNNELENMWNGIGGMNASTAAGMNQVTEATDNAIQAQIGAQQRIRDWLDGLMASDLGGLRPRDAMAEAQALFDRTLEAALGGDADAMGQLPQLADQLLRLGQRVYASGDPYFDLRDAIRAALEQVAAINPVDPTGNTDSGPTLAQQVASVQGPFGGNFFGDAGPAATSAAALDARAAAERRVLANELAGVIRDLVTSTGRPLDEIEETLGFSMADLVADLGVNLNELTAATATQLADIAQSTGTELSALAASVGVDLGSLADRQSMLNDALEAEVSALPPEQAAELEPMLRAIEDAAALGDTEGVEEGIAEMEAAINGMSPAIRDALAPYFEGIRPPDPSTQIGLLGSISGELASHTGLLAGILAGIGSLGSLNEPAAPSPWVGPLTPGGTLGGPPGYAVGTSYVPADGLAYLHRGEAVFPASVSEFFRREGIPIRPVPVLGGASSGQPGAGNDALIAELRELRRERREADEYTKRLEQRVQQLETTTARGDDAKVRALDRQTDVMKSGTRR